MNLGFWICFILGLSFCDVSARCSEKCTDEENVVWALGNGCSVYRNECHFQKANCARRRPMIITTKQKCQTRCPGACPFVYQPAQGNYMGQIRQFDNECYKAAHTCLTGETFL